MSLLALQSGGSNTTARVTFDAACRPSVDGSALNVRAPCFSIDVGYMHHGLWTPEEYFDENTQQTVFIRAGNHETSPRKNFRVRCLVANDTSGTVGSSAFEEYLAHRSCVGPPQPLSGLRWHEEDVDTTALYEFLTPCLVDFSLMLWKEMASQDLASILGAIQSRSPSLRSVKIAGSVGDHHDMPLVLIDAFSSLAAHLPDIQDLHIDAALNREAVTDIASRASLKSLTMSLSYRAPLPSFPINAFPSLEALRLKPGTSTDDLISIIRAISSPTLRDINLWDFAGRDVPTRNVKQLQLLFQTIAERPFVKTLESISVGLATEAHVTVAVVAPLLDAVGLRVVELNDCIIDNDVLRGMATAWPKLERLTVTGTSSKVTLDGLVPLLQHCPRLSHLDSFDLNMSGPVSDPDTWPKGDYANNRIKALSIGSSVIEDPRGVALFLSTFLPGVRRLEAYDWMSEDTDERNYLRRARVKETLRLLRDIVQSPAHEFSADIDRDDEDDDANEAEE